MSKLYKINGELIETSGKKLINVGYLMIGGIVLYGIIVLVGYNSTDYETLQVLSMFTIGVSIILTISIIVNIIGSGKGFVNSVQTYYEDGIHEEFYSNGELKVKGTYKDGKEDGLREEYYENGQLESKGTLKDGEWDGLLEAYNKNGELEVRGTYKDGKKDGVWEYYPENGELSSKETYKDGETID